MKDINDLNDLNEEERNTPRRRRRRELFGSDDGLGEVSQPTEIVEKVTAVNDAGEAPAEPVHAFGRSRDPLRSGRR